MGVQLAMVHIRRFESKDSESVKGLITEIMDREFPEDKSAFALGDLDSLQDSYGNDGEVFFVAENGSHVVGTVGVKREDQGIALLRRIFVAPTHRKKKIGLQLLNQAIDFCEKAGYRELVFKTTSKMTGAIGLVKNRGFQSRAKIPVGPVELLKFTLSLNKKNNHKGNS